MSAGRVRSEKKYWDLEHERVLREGGGRKLTYTKEILNEILEALDYNIKSSKIVEFGSGTGSNIVALNRLGVGECHAVDFSDSAIECLGVLNKNFKTRVIPHKKDIRNTGLKSGYFDIVFSEGLMEHFEFSDIKKYLVEQVRVTKPGGFLIINVPQTFHLYTIKKKILMLFGKWFAGWETQWSPREIKKIEAMFPEIKIVKFFYWSSPRFPFFEKLGCLSPWLSQHIGVVYQKVTPVPQL